MSKAIIFKLINFTKQNQLEKNENFNINEEKLICHLNRNYARIASFSHGLRHEPDSMRVFQIVKFIG